MGLKLKWTEVAYMCGVSRQTIRNWQRDRDFPAAEDNRFDESAVLEWCRVNGVRTVPVQR